MVHSLLIPTFSSDKVLRRLSNGHERCSDFFCYLLFSFMQMFYKAVSLSKVLQDAAAVLEHVFSRVVINPEYLQPIVYSKLTKR